MLATLRLLARRPARTTTTIAGIAIGYAAYLAIVSAASDLTRHLGARLAATGAEVAVRQAGIGLPVLSRIRVGDLPRIRTAARARSVAGILVQITRSEGGWSLPVVGLDPADDVAGLLAPRSGRWPRPGVREAVVGRGLARRRGLRLGSPLEVLPGKSYTVTGICESGNDFLDSACGLELGEAQRLFGMDRLVNLVFVKLEEPARVREAIEGIHATLPHLHATASELFFAGFHELEQIQRWITWVSIAVLGVSALVVASTVARNVAEREGELALLRAVGWSRGRILASLLAEGAVLGLAGGAAGLLGAWAFLRVSAAQGLALWIAPVLPPGIVFRGAVILVLSIFLGALPGLVAALRVRPARALRSL